MDENNVARFLDHGVTVNPLKRVRWWCAYAPRMLDALAGRTEPSSVQGTILVDGQRPSSSFKFMTGYVVQVTALTPASMQTFYLWMGFMAKKWKTSAAYKMQSR